MTTDLLFGDRRCRPLLVPGPGHFRLRARFLFLFSLNVVGGLLFGPKFSIRSSQSLFALRNSRFSFPFSVYVYQAQ